MQVRIWGARGSYPASGLAFSEFGHHTACVSVAAGDTLIVIDAGSGAAALGERLSAAPVRDVHILISHFHHDHISGLPFLLYGAGEGTRVAVHAAFGAEFPLRETVRQLFSAPYFPSEFGRRLDVVSFHAHPRRAGFPIGDVSVETEPLEHPGGSTGFGLRRARRAVVYVSDLETRLEPAPPLVALARQADLLLHDTMFTSAEAETRQGWGHSTAEAAAALARAANVGLLAGFHHSPLHDDAALRARESALNASFRGAGFAREGQDFLL